MVYLKAKVLTLSDRNVYAIYRQSDNEIVHTVESVNYLGLAELQNSLPDLGFKGVVMSLTHV